MYQLLYSYVSALLGNYVMSEIHNITLLALEPMFYLVLALLIRRVISANLKGTLCFARASV